MSDWKRRVDALIEAGWGDWPQSEIPPDVMEAAERGQTPARAPRESPPYWSGGSRLERWQRENRGAA